MSDDSNVEEKKEEQYPLRRKAVIRLRKGKEIPVIVSCRSDGACVILPRTMKDMMFPKVVEKAEKSKKEVKK